MASPDAEPVESSTAAWWVWTIGQAAVVSAFAARVRPTGGYPEPVEATADLGLACTQLVLAALLGRALFADVDRTIRASVPAVVLAVLAGGLAGRTTTETAALLAMTTLWLAALACLTRSASGRLIAAFLTIAGPVLYYARLEYNPASASASAWLAAAVPPVGVCTTRLHEMDGKSVLAPLSALLVTLAADVAVKTRDPR